MPLTLCDILDASTFLALARSAVGGQYIGDAVPCTMAICEHHQSACCLPDGTCQGLLQTECTVAGETFQGLDVFCASNPRPPLPGACCQPHGSCQDVADQAACTALGGTFQGAGTPCAATASRMAMIYNISQPRWLARENKKLTHFLSTKWVETKSEMFASMSAIPLTAPVVTATVDTALDAVFPGYDPTWPGIASYATPTGRLRTCRTQRPS